MLHATMCLFFFFNDTATTEIYTLSLHDALPIFQVDLVGVLARGGVGSPHDSRLGRVLSHRRRREPCRGQQHRADRKSTRLNSSHANISYAVFCLKKKKNT